MILYDPQKFLKIGVMLSKISGAPVEVPGKADEIIRQASLCTFVSFLTRYFLLRPPAQDTHAFDMVGISQLCISISRLVKVPDQKELVTVTSSFSQKGTSSSTSSFL